MFPNFFVLQPNLITFHESGVRGVFEEGDFQAPSDTEFAELKVYLLSKLMQDPCETDVDAEINGFLKAYYGDGWESIREFIDIASAESAKGHLPMMQKAVDTFPEISDETVKYCDGLWEKAAELAGGGDCLARVKRSELSWRFWKCANKKEEFSRKCAPWVWMKAQEQLYNDFKSAGITTIGGCGNESYNLTPSPTTYLLRTADKWRTRYDDWFTKLAAPLVEHFYHFVLFIGKIFD